VKAITDLRIGDQIRTAADNSNTGFTQFLGWLDRQKSSPVEMVQLFISDNNNYPAVTITASHVVFTSNTTKYAGDLVLGDTLLHWNGTEMKEQRILEIRTSLESGFWSPLTTAGTLLVNGYLMSCYSSYPHTLSDIALTPIKVMPRMLLEDDVSQHYDGVRKVVGLIKDIGQLFGTRKEKIITKKFPIDFSTYANDLQLKHEL